MDHSQFIWGGGSEMDYTIIIDAVEKIYSYNSVWHAVTYVFNVFVSIHLTTTNNFCHFGESD